MSTETPIDPAALDRAAMKAATALWAGEELTEGALQTVAECMKIGLADLAPPLPVDGGEGRRAVHELMAAVVAWDDDLSDACDGPERTRVRAAVEGVLRSASSPSGDEAAPAEVFLVWGVNYGPGGDEESTLLGVHADRDEAAAVVDRCDWRGERQVAVALPEWAEVAFDSVQGPDARPVLGSSPLPDSGERDEMAAYFARVVKWTVCPRCERRAGSACSWSMHPHPERIASYEEAPGTDEPSSVDGEREDALANALATCLGGARSVQIGGPFRQLTTIREDAYQAFCALLKDAAASSSSPSSGEGDDGRGARPWEGISDPALRAVAGGRLDGDALRWLRFADRELARLRDAAGLTGAYYCNGIARYEPAPVSPGGEGRACWCNVGTPTDGPDPGCPQHGEGQDAPAREEAKVQATTLVCTSGICTAATTLKEPDALDEGWQVPRGAAGQRLIGVRCPRHADVPATREGGTDAD